MPTGQDGSSRARERSPDKGKPRQEAANEELDGKAQQSRRRLPAREVARRGMDQVAEFTGRDPEGVTSLRRGGEGWCVGVEVVETRRIPDTSDILAAYEAELDEQGELISYRRLDRYARGRGNEH